MAELNARAIQGLTLVVLAMLAMSCGASGDNVDKPGGDGADTEATSVVSSSSYLTLPGTSSASFEVSADGAWTVHTEQTEWLRVEPLSGTGDATVTVQIDRSALPPGSYAGSLTFRGREPLATVTVAMRFPRVAGAVADDAGQVTAASVGRVAVADERGNAFDSLRPGDDYVPNELIVALDGAMARALHQGAGRLAPTRLAASDVAAVAEAIGADHGLAFVRQLPGPGVAVLMRTARPLADVMRALDVDGRVRRSEPNYLLRRALVPTDPLYDDQSWHFEMIGMPAAWDVTQGEDDVVVAVIDGSFDVAHPDLSNNLLSGYDFAYGDTDVGDASTYCGAHGTHVAGTIAAVGENGTGVTGIAPRVRVLPLKIGLEEAGCPLSLAAALDAIAFAAGLAPMQGGAPRDAVDVINLSFGGGARSFVFEDLIGMVVGNGVTVVAAAGNHQPDTSDEIMFPAAYAPAIAVGAVDADGLVAGYSNVGPELDVVAPGGTASRAVFSTVPGGAYGTSQGTSMATPHVAGLAALMRSVNRDISPTLITRTLRTTARDLGAAGFDFDYGHGLVDGAPAVREAQLALTATFDDIVVRLEGPTGAVVHEARADGAGAFSFAGVEAGDYRLVAGTDADGDGILGEGGEFHTAVLVEVDYVTGDQQHVLQLNPN